jgi:hypothetical protein
MWQEHSGEPILTTTDFEKGTGENAVAKAVVKSLKTQMPKDRFHIERDDGEEALGHRELRR